MTPDEARYPIGLFTYSSPYSAARRRELIDQIESLPDRLEATLGRMAPEGWTTPYRPGGWTVRQVVHHVPDSHLNAYVRFMKALVEDQPTVQPYDEHAWVELIESRAMPPEGSLSLLRAIHARWVVVLRSLTEAELRRTLFHPDHARWFSLDELIGMYAWHGEHHLAHVQRVARAAR